MISSACMKKADLAFLSLYILKMVFSLVVGHINLTVQMKKKVNKQCLLDNPGTVKVREKT